MKRRTAFLVLGLCCGALGLGTARAYVIPPEPLIDLGVGVSGGVDALTGTWTALASRDNALQLSLRPDHRGSEIQRSITCPVTELKLSPDQVAGPPKDVSFELVRDAGVLRFAGRFQSSEGLGRFTFVASADFLVAMRAFGYSAIDPEKAYALAVHDVSRWFIPELQSLGYRGLSFDQIVALRVHGADAAFIRALRAVGYDSLSADQLLRFRAQGVSPEFITQMRAVGYGRLSPSDLESLRTHGVSPGFVRELQALGYPAASPADLVNLRIHGVTPEFVRRVNVAAKAFLPVSRLVDLRAQTRP
jgi:hypothetical protein